MRARIVSSRIQAWTTLASAFSLHPRRGLVTVFSGRIDRFPGEHHLRPGSTPSRNYRIVPEPREDHPERRREQVSPSRSPTITTSRSPVSKHREYFLAHA